MSGDMERLAQRWHDEHVNEPGHVEAYSDCWCCCPGCDPDYEPVGGANPHFEAAMVQLAGPRPDCPGEFHGADGGACAVCGWDPYAICSPDA